MCKQKKKKDDRDSSIRVLNLILSITKSRKSASGLKALKMGFFGNCFCPFLVRPIRHGKHCRLRSLSFSPVTSQVCKKKKKKRFCRQEPVLPDGGFFGKKKINSSINRDSNFRFSSSLNNGESFRSFWRKKINKKLVDKIWRFFFFFFPLLFNRRECGKDTQEVNGMANWNWDVLSICVMDLA